MQNEKALRWAINIAALVVLMDLSAVNIAMPEMRAYFGYSVSFISLVLMISMLTATSSALIIGKISQLFSPKKLLIIGFSVFGLTTFLSGISHHFSFLLVLRFIQGFAESTLYVIGPALIKRYISSEKQATAYGQWMMSTGIGISIGPLIGGYLVGWFSWSAVFFINVPFVLLGLWFSTRLKLETPPKKHELFDNIGAFLSFGFLGSIIAAVNIGKQLGWKIAVLFLALAVLFFIAFLYREKKCKFPILHLNLFRVRNFWLASFGFFLFFVVNVGSRFLRPFYFEEGRGFDSELSGLLMVISPAVMVILSPFTGYFQRLWGVKNVVILGNLFLFISMILFSLWTQDSSLQFLIISMLLLGIGMGFYYPAATTIGMLALSNANSGMGSAVISSSKSMGKLIGVLVFAFLFSSYLEKLNINIDTAAIPERIAAIQFVFRVAAGISFIAVFFSFFFQKDKGI